MAVLDVDSARPTFILTGEMALKDAGISYDLVEQACVSYCYGDTTSGQAGVYELGMTGIPVYNVRAPPYVHPIFISWHESCAKSLILKF